MMTKPAIELLQNAIKTSKQLAIGNYSDAATVDISNNANMLPNPARDRKLEKNMFTAGPKNFKTITLISRDHD